MANPEHLEILKQGVWVAFAILAVDIISKYFIAKWNGGFGNFVSRIF
jgi:hypothetical protein